MQHPSWLRCGDDGQMKVASQTDAYDTYWLKNTM